MKICFNVSAMNKGGAERVVSSLANYFVKHDFDVYINLIASSETVSAYDLDDRIKLVSSLEKGKNNHFFKRVEAIKKTIIQLEPDVVIAFLPQVCIYSYFALKNTSIPLIVSERNDPNQYSILLKILLRYVFKRSKSAVFQTRDACLWYKKNPSKLDKIIFNPVYFDDCSFSKKQKNKKNEHIVIAVGRLSRQKNYFYMLKAFREFLKIRPEFSLHIFGSGYLDAKIKKFIKKNNLENKIVLEGVSGNWLSESIDADLFISTSKYEGMPNSLEEAACAGINCLSLDYPIGGAKELSLLLDNITLLPYKTNYIEFAKKMSKCILGESKFKKMPESLKIEKVSEKWLELIEECKK